MNDRQQTPDERIAAAARDLYNAPLEPPREEMWAEIEARLDAGTVLPLRSPAASTSSRRPNRRFGWWVGIAAALAIGLGLGRLTMRTPAPDARLAFESEVRATGETTVAETPSPGAALVEEDRQLDTGARSDQADARSDRAAPVASREAAAPAPALSGSTPGDVRDGNRRTPGLQNALATRQLLDRGQTFLATVQADLASGAPDPETEMWARSLLSRTRVLMASPAARAPETRRLLEDLELMLAQIVVTSATGDPGEARILGEGFEEGNLLNRLRSATEDDSGPGAFRTPGTSSL